MTNLPYGGLSHYLGAVLFTLGGLAFISSSRHWPATSRSPSPTVPASHRGSRRARSRSSSAGASSAVIVGGLIAGFAALWISRVDVPRVARGLMPVVVIPLLASLIVGLLMFLLLGRPLAAITSG